MVWLTHFVTQLMHYPRVPDSGSRCRGLVLPSGPLLKGCVEKKALDDGKLNRIQTRSKNVALEVVSDLLPGIKNSPARFMSPGRWQRTRLNALKGKHTAYLGTWAEMADHSNRSTPDRPAKKLRHASMFDSDVEAPRASEHAEMCDDAEDEADNWDCEHTDNTDDAESQRKLQSKPKMAAKQSAPDQVAATFQVYDARRPGLEM
eukprot:313179-Amphidinium_carterae.4